MPKIAKIKKNLKDQEMLKRCKKVPIKGKKENEKIKTRVQHWKCELYMDNKDVVSTSQSQYFQKIYRLLGT